MSVPHYITHDPYLSAFVLDQGAVLAGMRRVGPKKVEFRFEASPALHELLRLYWSELPTLVVPRRLFAKLQLLKRRSFAQW